MKTKIIVTLLLGFISSSVLAAGKWVAKGTIEGVYVDNRASFERILFRHSIPRDGDDCSNNGNYYELEVGTDFGKHALSVILSAEASQRELILFLDGCSSSGFPIAKIVSSIKD